MLEIENFDSKLSYGYDLIFVSAKLGCDNLKTLYTICLLYTSDAADEL